MDFNIKRIAAVLFLTVFLSCNQEKEVKPIVQDIKELVFASGELEWDNAYNLTAQTDGVLEEADFEVGNQVLKEKILAIISNKNNAINTQMAQEQLVISNENLSPNSPQMQQLHQNIQFAETKYNQDKLQEERYKRLLESQSIAKLEYENAVLNAKNSLANWNALKEQLLQIKQQAKQQNIASKGQLQNYQVLQNYNRVTATEAGTVIKKLKTKGDYVKKGEVIAVIANAKIIQAVLHIDENSIAKIKLGQAVYIQLNTNKNLINEGKISEILTAFDEKTQSFICKASFNAPLTLSLFGTQLEANILVAEKKHALLIPRSYLGFGNKVRVKAKAEEVIIRPGIISTDYVEVLSGINQNDILIPLKL